MPALRAAAHTQEASLAPPPLASCRAARVLTGHGLAPNGDPGVGDPFLKAFLGSLGMSTPALKYHLQC